MTKRMALLVRNGDKPDDWLTAVIGRLETQGVSVVDAACDGSDMACRKISEHGPGVDLVIVAGGDGTLNGAAPALLELGKPVGILPLGTANDLARTLGVPADMEAAADVIAAGLTRRIDVGLVNDQPFFNVASIGLAAKLAETLDAGAKRRFGRISYAMAALRVLLGAQTFRAAIAVGGRVVRVRSYQIAVGNGRYHGGGVAVREDAHIDDGRLSLYSLGPGSLWKVVLLAPLFRRGRHVRWREVRTARAAELEIRTAEPMPVNVDGDLVTETPLKFAVRHCAIEVFVPAS